MGLFVEGEGDKTRKNRYALKVFVMFYVGRCEEPQGRVGID